MVDDRSLQVASVFVASTFREHGSPTPNNTDSEDTHWADLEHLKAAGSLDQDAACSFGRNGLGSPWDSWRLGGIHLVVLVDGSVVETYRPG